MSKAKDAVNDLRNKIFDRKKEEVVQEAEKKIQETMEYTVYDAIVNPNTESRTYLMVKIVYDLQNKTASIQEIVDLPDKTTALSIIMDKETRKFFFEKNRKRETK